MSKDTRVTLKNRVVESVSIHLNTDKIRKKGVSFNMKQKIDIRKTKKGDV